MKFTINTFVLKNITGMLTKVVSRDTPGSSGGVLVSVEGDFVIFKTQQFDFNLIYSFNVESPEQGSVFIPIGVFETIIGSLSDSLVTIELKDKKLHVKTNTSKSEIFILDEEEGEIDILRPDINPSFSIEREIFVQGLKNVQHAAATSVIKPEIASIYICTQGKNIYFVATDTFRLAESRFTSETISDGVQILISIKNIQKIIRVLEGITDSVVDIYGTEEGIFIATETIIIKTSMVRGSFPDYKKIIPKTADGEIIILKSDITNFLKKSRLFTNKIIMSMTSKENLVLHFENETVGLTENTIPVVVKGDVGDIPPFEHKFISDALVPISDEKIVLTISKEKNKPMMIRGINNTSFTAIISPLSA